ncbi:hypothetical protein [Methylorubrum extorquens]|uniref:hypothetical protein n=1 Tax=Methylorubrum extorquens TaxID=408 RepID=UPI001EE5533F|nr:hypothetical protein [Methylorubrum extorquens]MCG5248101.1 hypothetical protein [Methylorubrum extorquens]
MNCSSSKERNVAQEENWSFDGFFECKKFLNFKSVASLTLCKLARNLVANLTAIEIGYFLDPSFGSFGQARETLQLLVPRQKKPIAFTVP